MDAPGFNISQVLAAGKHEKVGEYLTNCSLVTSYLGKYVTGLQNEAILTIIYPCCKVAFMDQTVQQRKYAHFDGSSSL